MSRKRSVETKSLTKSFGWQSAQSFEQHDTQEFCRVLFDAIEQSFAIAGEQCTRIRDLYEGQLVSYVRCDECGYESKHSDKYLDLSLPIKNNPTGSDRNSSASTNTSLEMALESFMRPEYLEGDNKYECQQCHKKVNATKGLKLETLPHILTIQLNRFTLDWTTFQMVKVHDKVTFPFILNGNNYLNGYDGILNKSSNCSPEPMAVTPQRDLRQPVAFEVSLERGHSEQDVQMTDNSSPAKNKGDNETNLNASETTMASS